MECPTFLLLGELLLQTEYMEFLCTCVCLSSGHVTVQLLCSNKGQDLGPEGVAGQWSARHSSY